jgi:putative ABC transport system permease protein
MNNFLFQLKEGFLISLKAIRANKARSVLTTLGIVIGVTSVVLMSTAIAGIDKSFQSGVSSLGSDNLYIDKWSWFGGDLPWWEMRNRRSITLKDYKEFKRLAKLPLAVAPSAFKNMTVKYDENVVDGVLVLGSTSEYINTTNLNFASGRFFTEIESKGGRNVAVIGSNVAKKLFPRGSGLNKTISLKGYKYKVIGVLEEQGSWLMQNFNPDNQVFIPIESMFKHFKRRRSTITINVRAPNSSMVDEVTEEAITIMRRIRGLKYDEINDFSINKQDALLKNIDQTVGVIQIAGFFITGLSLFVGAIGIMNIMFVSVKERTKEIGIRKAIGATRKTILGQFLAEAALICLIGGLIGLVLAILGSMIISQYDFPVSVQAGSVVLAIGISLITGIISGLAPAYTAAKMDPVDALRYE